MATYTTLSPDEVAHLLGQYRLTARSAGPLAGGAANSSYLVHTDDATFVLTVLDNHDRESAQRLADLLEHLATHGIATTRPVRTGAGASLAWSRDRPVLLKEYIGGRSDTPLPAGGHRAAGETLARLHAVPPPAFLPGRGRRLPAGWGVRAATFADREFADWLRSQWDLARRVEDLGGPCGLVHGDYFADNLVVRDDGQIAVLDWETATNDLLVLDLGMAIVGLCRENGRFLPDRAVDLLHGYVRHRPLGAEERGRLHDATRYASLCIAYHRYVRHHLTHPDVSKQHLYREMPRFVDSVDDLWPERWPWDPAAENLFRPDARLSALTP